MQATPKPIQRRLATGEEKKAPKTHKRVVYDTPTIAMTTEEQDATIRVAFYNEDTVMKEIELQYATGKKMTNLVKPWNESLLHPASDLLETYAMDGCPENCVPYWTKDNIEAALRRGLYPLENLSSAMAALHTKTPKKIKMDTLRWCDMGI